MTHKKKFLVTFIEYKLIADIILIAELMELLTTNQYENIIAAFIYLICTLGNFKILFNKVINILYISIYLLLKRSI